MGRSTQLIVLIVAMIAMITTVPVAAEERALLIGINDYLANDVDASQTKGQSWIPEDLNGALNDVALMRHTLLTRFGFDESNITSLLDEDATRENMLKVMREFAASTQPGDIVYFHFSGHGSQVDDASGDEADKLDETILPYDARTGGIADITDDELQAIFGQLRAESALIVLDSCHSGTATRGSTVLKTRSTPLDPRGELYANVEPQQGGATNSHYVLMTGAADYQSALDGPLDNGRYYGLFTWSLAKSLGRTPIGASARDIHADARKEMQEIGARFGLWSVPESQLEADEAAKSLPLLTESRLDDRAVTRLPYATVVSREDGTLLLKNAALMGAAVDSYWAIHDARDATFSNNSELVRASVIELIGNDALAQPDQAVRVDDARAVQLLAGPGSGEIGVRLNIESAQLREAVGDALRRVPKVQVVQDDSFARYLIEYSGDRFNVFSAGGLQAVEEVVTRDAAVLAERFATLASRAQAVDDLLALNNGATDLRIEVSVTPQDEFGGVRGIKVVGAADAMAYRIRRSGEPRNRSNSLMLEIEVSEDSYITVVDVDPDGSIGTLFPNSISDRRGFYRDGFIAGKRRVSIPDSLTSNSAGFYWDYSAPAGVDTIRVFAARDLATANTIRQYISELASNVNTRGDQGGRDPRKLFAAARTIQQRGVQTVAADEAPGRADWAAATTMFVVEE
jgi:hypothetical protein